MLIEKVCQWTFLYDTKSPDYTDQHMRANAWEGIGKELKIKSKFYVSSRDVRIVCPRLDNSCRENENTFCSVIFFLNCAVYGLMWEKYCRIVQATDENMGHAHCILDN